ncbi:bile acid:sodium symporter [Streptomyces pathocidini]|uniref:Bile acid:sodium symporter n=1 Tax=Streptomyces pathocidini TaxID=1650571 RepID=A0ABW7UJY4_9ACTN|nr:bile acid:sodium symporter [Streptomyces pathocidini]
MPRRRPTLPSWLPLDPYILVLLGTVALAALLPARGAAATAAEGASTGAVALVFFLYGARLSTREAREGLSHWRLHLTVLACTFAVFPLLGLAARGLVPYVLAPDLYAGFLIAIVFAGSKKSLAAGLPMATVLFGAQASLAVLPLMLFHQMQLMVCAVIARRRSRDPLAAVRIGELPAPAGESVPAGR